MRITTEAEARAAVASVAAWLATGETTGDEPWVDPRFEDRDDVRSDELSTAGLARDLCHLLLRAAESNGLGACRLCGS